ncbi:MAG: sigma-70 family RNA polymerase sigma factor, partial [Acidobacteriota bacterium]
NQGGSGRPVRRGRFVTTRWSLVVAAGNREVPGWREALADLCGTYWYPIYAYARRLGKDPEEAQDLTQEFFTRLLERNALTHVRREKGRFRSFLLASFKNFVTDEARRALAKKRGGGQAPLPFELETAEGRYLREPSHDETPDKIFERRWAMALLERSVERLRREHEEERRKHSFDVLRQFLPGGSAVPYAEAARQLGVGEVAMKVTIHRFRRRFRTVLLDEIAHTVQTPEEVDEEVRHLMAALDA